MIDYFSSFLSTTLHALEDLIKPRTWVKFAQKEAGNVLDVGKWQGLLKSGFEGNRWLIWTGLLFAVSIAIGHGWGAAADQFGAADATPFDSISPGAIAIDTVGSVVIGVFSAC